MVDERKERRIDPEILAAYVDGALFPEERRAVESRLRSDASAGEALRILERERLEERRSGYAASGEGGESVVREGRSAGHSDRVRRGRRLDSVLGLGIAAAAAALVVAVVLSGLVESRTSNHRVTGPARIVAMRGEAWVVEGPFRRRPVDRWETFQGGERIDLGPRGELRVLRTTGLYRLSEAGWKREIERIPRSAEDLVTTADGAVEERSRSAAADGPSPIGPVAVVETERPDFRWRDPRPGGRAETGYDLLLEGEDGVVLRLRTAAPIVALPSRVPSLRRGRVYVWKVSDAGPDASAAGALFEATFRVAAAGELADLERACDAIRDRVGDRETQDLLVALEAWDRRFLGRAAGILSGLNEANPGDPMYRALLARLPGGRP